MAEWATIISKEAMEIVKEYEIKNKRIPEEVHRRGFGYDIHSMNGNEEMFIEVKGVSEAWKTYSWQSLHHTTKECLDKNPDKFFLYIVYFDIFEIAQRDGLTLSEARTQNNLQICKQSFYIIKGNDLKNNFNIKPENFRIRSISKSSLEKYKIDTK